MEVLFVVVPLAVGFAGLGCLAFYWAQKKGQFDDMKTPAEKVLIDDLEE